MAPCPAFCALQAQGARMRGRGRHPPQLTLPGQGHTHQLPAGRRAGGWAAGAQGGTEVPGQVQVTLEVQAHGGLHFKPGCSICTGPAALGPPGVAGF